MGSSSISDNNTLASDSQQQSQTEGPVTKAPGSTMEPHAAESEGAWKQLGDDIELEDKGAEPAKEKDEEIPEFVTGFKLFLVMTGLTVVMFLAMLDMAIVSTAIPKITSDFHRLQDVGWYISAYQLASATVQPLTGKLYQKFSTKWVYLITFLVFELGSVLCGAAQSSTMLIVGRAVAGMGCAGISNGTLTILVGAFPAEKRPFFTAIAMGISQIGIVLGPLLGGAFTQHATWRWCFYINLPLGGVAALFLLFIHIPDPTARPPVTKKYIRSILPVLDLIGFAIFAPASIMFLLALQFGSGQYGWDSSQVIGLFCGSGATLIIFIFWERRMGDDAMIPGSMVSQMVVLTSCLNIAFLMTAAISSSSFLPIYFQSVKGLSPTMSGVYMLGSILSQIIFVLISGAFITRLGYYIPWALVACSGAAIGIGLMSTWKPSTDLGPIIGYQVIFGLRGLGVQVGMIAIQNYLPRSKVAIGNSIMVFSQNFVSAVFVTVGNTIFQTSLKKNIIAHVPSVSPAEAIAAGGSASAVRSLAPPGSPALAALLEAYSNSFDKVCYMMVGLSVFAFFTSFGMGWVDLRKKKEPEKAEP